MNFASRVNYRLLGMAVVLVVPLASGLPAKADSLYVSNFDSVGQKALSSGEAGKSESLSKLLPGWSVTADNITENNAIIADGTISGSHPALGAYIATGDGSSFNLSIYDNAGNASVTDSISYTYTNTTGVTLSGIGGQFDYVAAWSRNASPIYGDEALIGRFERGMQYAVSGGGQSENVSNTKWTITNANGNVTRNTIANYTWLTDAQMSVWRLSERDVQFTVPGVLLPGQSLTLTWVESGSSTDFMAKGIENFQLDDNLNAGPGGPGSDGNGSPIVPSPAIVPATLVGTAMTCGFALARRRRQVAR